jgi:hypothetical protein
MKNIKTFEQFTNLDVSVDRIDEGLFGNNNKAIAAFVEDMTSGKFEKTDKLKKALAKYQSHAKRQMSGITKRMIGNVRPLADYLNTKGDAPENLEELVAMAVLGDDKVGKDDKGIWKAQTKISSHGTGGAGAAKWN